MQPDGITATIENFAEMPGARPHLACAVHGGGNLVPLGPDASAQHRAMVSMKTERMNEEIEKRGVRPVPVEVESGARNGGAIRCATLVLNRDD